MVHRFVLAAILAAEVAAAPVGVHAAEFATPGGLAALKEQAERVGRVRVLVELKASPHASPRHIRGLQHRVVGMVLGGTAWRDRETGKDPHAVSLMRVTPMFAASVTAAELDRLATNHRVRRIREDGRAAPTVSGPVAAP